MLTTIPSGIIGTTLGKGSFSQSMFIITTGYSLMSIKG
jgi:hypothetical protein